ncbi:MAG: AbrB/MazE/SpoVT family DNA-binding domain-containing protein [Proteobacteria bacterium]|nr:AbrB/MazE/SpoVT family DNA-binding domain-containing protein [Pseudomonadota bacterium]
MTLPKEIRDQLRLKAGSGVTFERIAGGEVVLRPTKPKSRSPRGAYVKHRGRATVRMTTEEIMDLTRGE